MLRSRPSLLAIVWLVIGLIVAANHGYLGGIKDVSDLLSALLAIVAWPLVLLNVNVAI
jgi:ABC-type Na+ efflux pump permease subunit